jgi:hypothetical protein
MLPICILHNTVINQSDIIATCVLFLIFLFWIQINNQTINSYDEIKNMTLYNKKTTPGIAFFAKLLQIK